MHLVDRVQSLVRCLSEIVNNLSAEKGVSDSRKTPEDRDDVLREVED